MAMGNFGGDFTYVAWCASLLYNSVNLAVVVLMEILAILKKVWYNEKSCRKTEREKG